MSKISRFFDYLKNKKESINSVVPWFLMCYFIIISLPYLFARIPSINGLLGKTLISYGIRFGMLFLFSLLGIVLHISNKKKPNYILIALLFVLSLLSLVSNFISPDHIIAYSTMFTSKIRVFEWRITTYDRIVDSLRFFFSCVFFYFLFSVYPFAFKDKNSFTYVIMPAVVIALVGVLYTLTFELTTFIEVVNGNLLPTSVRSIFHSKNAYGIFLFEGSASLAYIFFTDTRRWFKLSSVFLPVFLVISFFIKCRLATICILILLLLITGYSVFYYFKKKPYISFIILGIVLLFAMFIVLLFSIEALHSWGFLKAIYDKFLITISSFDIKSLIDRTEEWKMVPLMTNGIFLWIGFSRASGYAVINAFTSTNGGTGVADLHNVYVDFFAYNGIIGSVILTSIYIFVIYSIVRLSKTNKEQAILIGIILFVSILFGMAETYTLFISISANTFALNFIIIVPLLFFLNESKGIKNENE